MANREDGIQDAEEHTARRAFSIGEASQTFGVSPDSFWRAKKAGKLRTIRIGGRVLVPAAEIERIARDGLEIKRGRPRKIKGESVKQPKSTKPPTGGNGHDQAGSEGIAGGVNPNQSGAQ
jgi:hypothetical protein